MSGNCKRGSIIFDWPFYAVMLFIAIVALFFIVKISVPIASGFMHSTQISEDTQNKVAFMDNLPQIADNIVAILFIILWLAVLVASYFLDSHPIFFIIMVFILILFIMAGGLIGDFLVNLVNDPKMFDVASQMPMTTILANYYIFILTAVGFSILLVMYAKRSSL